MSNEKWYSIQHKQSTGVFSKEQLITMVHCRTISGITMILEQGTNVWEPIQKVFDLDTELSSLIPHIRSVEETIGWSDRKPHPWRRYFARTIDVYVAFILIVVLVCGGWAAVNFNSFKKFILASDFLNRWTEMFLGMGAYFFSMFVNAVFIGFTGGTFGKWLFGVYVVGENSKPIGFIKALKREFFIWWAGIAFAIPIVAQILLFLNYDNLLKDRITYWDKKMELTVLYRDKSMKQSALSWIGFLIYIFHMSLNFL
jgi:uncharacterized RDD family membrane protein YckC